MCLFVACPVVMKFVRLHRFVEVLDTIQKRHKDIPEIVAKGCKGLRSQLQRYYGDGWYSHPDSREIQRVLEQFFLNRTGVRFLCGQQLNLHNQVRDGDTISKTFGLVDLEVVKRAWVHALRRS